MAHRCRSSRWCSCFLPSPLVGEGGAKRRMRGIALHEESHCGTNPSPKRVCRTALAALSQKGRGHFDWQRRKDVREETRKCPPDTKNSRPSKTSARNTPTPIA